MDKELIFAAALGKTSREERERYLEEACRDQPELRAELDALLAACDDAGSFLNRPPDELHATFDPAGDAADADQVLQSLLEPTDKPNRIGQLGRYDIIEQIGRGGMGIVLRAFDPGLNRIVAIKILAPAFAHSPTAVRRFLREARAAAAVSHDHVVTIHAIDETLSPPVIVMEMIDGRSLQQKIDQEGPLEVKAILRIGMQAAAGLAAAHRQGLVHRDIKPANILLENGIERVKLTDFGLARAVDDIGMTRTGTITGTPQYMSPEQAQGQRVDSRTDLFSLGCVMYAMCTGQAAFRADSAVAVMHRIVHEDPVPISRINEDVPDWLCEIVERLLAKRPEDRFASAQEVEDLLSRHLAHLQQPQSVPQPQRLNMPPRPAATTRWVSELTPGLERELNGVAMTFAAAAMLCFAGTFFAYLAHDQSWYPGAAVVVWLMAAGTVISFPILILGAIRLNWGILLGRKPGVAPLRAARVAKIPWNPLLLLTLPWAMRADRILHRPDVLAVLGVDQDGPLSERRAKWTRRLPVPVLVALLLFGGSLLSMLSEISGATAEFHARPIGVACFVLGCVTLLGWGAWTTLRRWWRGAEAKLGDRSLPWTTLVPACLAITAFTGIVTWQWAELGNRSDRERLIGYFQPQGWFMVELRSPQTRVEVNGEPIEVPRDGRIVICPDRAGRFLVSGSGSGGWTLNTEVEIPGATFSTTFVPANAELISITGPYPGRPVDFAQVPGPPVHPTLGRTAFFEAFVAFARNPAARSDQWKQTTPVVMGPPQTSRETSDDGATFDIWKVTHTISGTPDSLHGQLVVMQDTVAALAETSGTRLGMVSMAHGPGLAVTGIEIAYTAESTTGTIHMTLAGCQDLHPGDRQPLHCELTIEIRERIHAVPGHPFIEPGDELIESQILRVELSRLIAELPAEDSTESSSSMPIAEQVAATIAEARAVSPDFLRVPARVEARWRSGQFNDAVADLTLQSLLPAVQSLDLEVPAMTQFLIAEAEAGRLSGARLELALQFVKLTLSRVNRALQEEPPVLPGAP